MKLNVLKKYGSIMPHTQEDKDKLDSFKDGAIYSIEIKNMDLRSNIQNRSLHLWCNQISSLLNDSGLYVNDILKLETEWSMEKVKENIFKPVVASLYDKKSTTKLNKNEFEKIIDVITLAFSNKGIEIPPFPNKKDL